jgi:hypothetical protein
VIEGIKKRSCVVVYPAFPVEAGYAICLEVVSKQKKAGTVGFKKS